MRHLRQNDLPALTWCGDQPTDLDVTAWNVHERTDVCPKCLRLIAILDESFDRCFGRKTEAGR